MIHTILRNVKKETSTTSALKMLRLASESENFEKACECESYNEILFCRILSKLHWEFSM